jgi:hypothetical protein
MCPEDRGLSRRLKIEGRRIASQHRRLGELWQQLLAAFEHDQIDVTRSAFRELREGLLAHFDLEERIQIPALHGSNADLQPQPKRIVEDHMRFRAELEALARQLDAGSVDDLHSPARELHGALNEHEVLEQSLFPGLKSADGNGSK